MINVGQQMLQNDHTMQYYVVTENAVRKSSKEVRGLGPSLDFRGLSGSHFSKSIANFLN